MDEAETDPPILNLCHPCVAALEAVADYALVEAMIQLIYHTALLAAREVPSAIEQEQFNGALLHLQRACGVGRSPVGQA